MQSLNLKNQRPSDATLKKKNDSHLIIEHKAKAYTVSEWVRLKTQEDSLQYSLL